MCIILQSCLLRPQGEGIVPNFGGWQWGRGEWEAPGPGVQNGADPALLKLLSSSQSPTCTPVPPLHGPPQADQASWDGPVAPDPSGLRPVLCCRPLHPTRPTPRKPLIFDVAANPPAWARSPPPASLEGVGPSLFCPPPPPPFTLSGPHGRLGPATRRWTSPPRVGASADIATAPA